MVCDTRAERLLWPPRSPTGSTEPDEVAGMEAEQQHSALTGSKANHKHHQNTQPHIKAGFPAVVCLAAEFSQRHEVNRVRGQLQDRHPFTTVNAFSPQQDKCLLLCTPASEGLSPTTAPVCCSPQHSGSPLLGRPPATPALA